MLIKDLTKVWVSEYEVMNNYGEKTKKWKIKKDGITINNINEMSVKKLNELKVKELSIKDKSNDIWLNIQQDINELDRNSSGEIDYSIENARTDMDYDIQKGNGISITDISNVENFVPEYIVTDKIKIGRTTLYKLEKYNGN